MEWGIEYLGICEGVEEGIHMLVYEALDSGRSIDEIQDFFNITEEVLLWTAR